MRVRTVSAAVISPVILPALPRVSDRASGAPGGAALARLPLPLPLLITRRASPTVYGLAAIDDRGRLADRAVMRALGWSAGLRLDIRETRGLLAIRPQDHGELQVTGQGHLRLPALLRHRCGQSGFDLPG